jgi:hypothetical protein
LVGYKASEECLQTPLILKLIVMKTIKYMFSISIGLLVLMLIEGLFTMGSAFDFATYSAIGWIAQVVAIMFIVSASILCCHSELMEDK